MGKGRPATDGKAIDVAKRRAQLLELRRAGYTFQEIVTRHPELGYRSASNAVQDAQRALHKLVDEPARDVLALELSRLNALTQGLWKAARSGDEKAVDRVLRVMERRAKLLGLDYADRNTDAQGVDGAKSLLADLAVALGMDELDPAALTDAPEDDEDDA